MIFNILSAEAGSKIIVKKKLGVQSWLCGSFIFNFKAKKI